MMNVWIAALVAVVTGVVGVVLAHYIHKPVRAFAVRSALISQGELDPGAPLPRTYRELEKANETLVQQIVARRATEREYGQTFEMASRGMAQLAPETGQFLRVNSRFCKITGHEPAELGQMRLADLLPQETGPGWSSGMFIGDHETELRHKAGHPVWVRINAIMIRDHAGQPLHTVLTLDDVTEAHQRAAQIQRLNRDLTHLARGHTMGQMASGLAHELNQPLTAIAQNADAALLTLTQSAPALPDPGVSALREILAQIERQALRAGDIIRALRGFIRKDEGTRSTFDFGDLLDQTLRLVHAEVVESGVSIETRLAPGLPLVDGNRVQIAQVLVNLIRNAIEAMAETRSNERRISLQADLDKDGALRVVVQDSGPGLAPDLPLFTPFETTKPGGLGLGLSICRTIIEAHGGTLDHEPGPGLGSGARFVFTLPSQRGTGAEPDGYGVAARPQRLR